MLLITAAIFLPLSPSGTLPASQASSCARVPLRSSDSHCWASTAPKRKMAIITNGAMARVPTIARSG